MLQYLWGKSESGKVMMMEISYNKALIRKAWCTIYSCALRCLSKKHKIYIITRRRRLRGEHKIGPFFNASRRQFVVVVHNIRRSKRWLICPRLFLAKTSVKLGYMCGGWAGASGGLFFIGHFSQGLKRTFFQHHLSLSSKNTSLEDRLHYFVKW